MGMRYYKRVPNSFNKLFNYYGMSRAQKKGFAFFSPLWTDSDFKKASNLFYQTYDINDKKVGYFLHIFII